MSPGGWEGEGEGEGKAQATAPRLTAGTGLSRHRCGTTVARAQRYSSQSLEGSKVVDSGVASLHRALRDPKAQAKGTQISRCPAPPPGGAGSPGHHSARSLRPSFLHPGLKNLGSQTGDYLQAFPDIRAQISELGIRTPSAPASLFGAETPPLQGDPGIWDSPALPPGDGLISAPRVRGTQESGRPTALSRRLRSLGLQRPI